MDITLSQLPYPSEERVGNCTLPPRPSSICQVCWEGPFAMQFGLTYTPPGEEQPLDNHWPESYSYWTSMPDLDSRALAGCVWCRFLVAAIRTEPVYDPATWPDTFELEVGSYVERLGPDEERLTTSGRRGKYLTLSYVWGGDQVHKTTTTNISTYSRAIDPSLLPATIRDAIYVTHTLGFQFLWIDSLCIIQDSDGDKMHEIGHMHDIYRYAHLTIVAASAERATQGFLQDRPSPPQMDISNPLTGGDFTIPFICPPLKSAGGPGDHTGAIAATTQQVGTIHITPHHSHTEVTNTPDSWLYSADEGPITTRAWCMQEYLLSPRVLVFTSKTLHFRCQTTIQNNVGNSLCEVLSESRLPDTLMLPGPHTRLADHDSAEWDQIHEVWEEVMAGYSKRSASVPSDKLVACAAIAQQFHRVLGTDYLAGLWRHSLVFDLLWNKQPFMYMRRPSAYRAPSWSWAAVDGAFFCYHIRLSKTPPVVFAKVVRCEVTLKDRALPFGQVTGGTLVLRAPLIRCVLRPDKSPEHRTIAFQSLEQTLAWHQGEVNGDLVDEGQATEVDGRKLPGTASFDCEADVEIEKTWAIPLVQDQYSLNGLIIALADSEVGARTKRGKVCYRRVGWFSIQFPGYADADSLQAAHELARALKAGEYPAVDIELV
ncbi:hypothetical protein TRAPUB_9844 [Trametes pubescens]|uniref:Heterokaryon incompatibility domain-containing protein n=1 Tax=Trametes pubescens TaxID=154538 RepID=A0A1M2W187_TRAPU|nr:hypothetical protein TRAPUB_9844 [Trametes pubescens]